MNNIPNTTGAAAVYEEEGSGQRLFFQEIGKRQVVADFEGGNVSSDAGALLLERLEKKEGYLKRFSANFKDYRNEDLIEHKVKELLSQRIFGLTLGYEDLNDHDILRLDPLLAMVCGKVDILGEKRHKEEDRGKGLAGKSTLNRLELTTAGASQAQRYKKIMASEEGIERYFIEEYVRSLSCDTTEVILDLDATDDPLHGNQEGRFFHGYYGNYCYLPLYVFGGDWPIMAKLRVSNTDASAGAVEAVEKVVAALRVRFADLKITLRADSGFCRDALMNWCELNGVFYIFGMARNAVLERKLAGAMIQAQRLSQEQTGRPARVFTEFAYGAESWEKHRWVVGKAEWTHGEANPRFILTNLNVCEFKGQQLYEKVYCGRGNMENRIKEQQLDLFADRTSTHTMRANQLRLWFSTLAYLLLNRLRRVGLQTTDWAHATCGTIRARLLKIGATIKITVRRIRISMSSAFPLQKLFRLIYQRLELLPQSG